MLNYFKSNRITSFLRQLDLYGFVRTKAANGYLRFSHPIFRRGNETNFGSIKRKRQYQPEPKEIVDYQLISQVVKALEKEQLSGRNWREATRLLCLFNHILTFKKFYGKNTEIYIRKFITHTRFYFPELHRDYEKEYHCLFVKLHMKEFVRKSTEELGLNVECIERAGKKELFVDLINNLACKYNLKYCTSHDSSENAGQPTDPKNGFVRIVPNN